MASTSETNAGSQKRRYTDRDIERDRKVQAEQDELIQAQKDWEKRIKAGVKTETFRLAVPARAPIRPPKRKKGGD